MIGHDNLLKILGLRILMDKACQKLVNTLRDSKTKLVHLKIIERG